MTYMHPKALLVTAPPIVEVVTSRGGNRPLPRTAGGSVVQRNGGNWGYSGGGRYRC